jgi:hypothetical protein
MELIQLTIRNGQIPTEDQLQEVQAAAKLSSVFDVDCLPSNIEALAEFAAKARELRRTVRRIKPAVSIRLSQNCIDHFDILPSLK